MSRGIDTVVVKCNHHGCTEETAVDVKWFYDPGVRTFSNGDPGYPPDFEIEYDEDVCCAAGHKQDPDKLYDAVSRASETISTVDDSYPEPEDFDDEPDQLA